MKKISKRSILRWTHIILSIPIIGYVYSPFENIPQYAAPTRYVFLPLLVLTGLIMWKGHALRRLISKDRPAKNKNSSYQPEALAGESDTAGPR